MNRSRSYQSALGRDIRVLGADPGALDAAARGSIDRQVLNCGGTGWYDHAVQEFRIAGAGVTTVLTHRVVSPDLSSDGFQIRLQHQYDQLLNNIATANGTQTPGLTWRVRVNERLLDRQFLSSPIDGQQWVPVCVKTGDLITIQAVIDAGLIGLFTNGQVVRVRAEVLVGDASMPYITPFNERENSIRSDRVTLAPVPLVPTILVGPGLAPFTAKWPNTPLLAKPNTVYFNVEAGSAQVFVHGVDAAGVIDAAGQATLIGLPQLIRCDRLDKIAISKPAAAAATISVLFSQYD